MSRRRRYEIDFSRGDLENIVEELQINLNELENILDNLNDDEIGDRYDFLEPVLQTLEITLNPALVANANNNNNNNGNSWAGVNNRRALAEASIENAGNLYPNALEGNARRRRSKSRKTRRR
jgi:hypothetical protein